MRGLGIRGWSEVSEMARVAEDIGLDSLWVVDHLLYQLEGEDRPRGCWEAWSFLSALAATTRRVEIGTLVLAMGWRNPALLAKMADTVDEISGGRLILGLGSGYHKPEYDAFGFPFDYKVSRFEEAIQIVSGLLRGGEVDFSGKYYSARECELKPRGPRPSGPPILIGTNTGSPRMHGLTARYADSWNLYYDNTHNKVEGFVRALPEIEQACALHGRDIDTLEATVTVMLADSRSDAWWDRLPTDKYAGEGPLVPLAGTPEHIAEELCRYHSAGVAHVQLSLEPTTCATIEALAPILAALRAGSG
jgi:alkanesulfonate monooxygenase SsuD/methylene tetrahydromethanopterin reductase-like flavin-dependent oxidoreductase (luciferase family)